MTELHLASGFLPRVDRRNHRGVERTLAPRSDSRPWVRTRYSSPASCPAGATTM